ncbi:MAG: endonuclease III [Nitrospinae bacterium CG11_big_fil_rev_8_21_14_0_20_56_8]|nr:MAG: endonuclease III [Nitrospinae bacterium CG11_big_fil_rev_8_21_14_0_20_56_8]
MARVLKIVEQANRKWSTPALDKVARRKNPFHVLVGCILSLRTRDAVTLPASRRLLRRAGTPAKLVALTEEEIQKAVYPVAFYRNKARNLRELCRELLDRHAGRVPDSIEELVQLKGVGRKTANLTVILGYGKPGICVDVHVHRICNRWGFVNTRSPDETETALRDKLPRRHWNRFNGLLVTFGQNLCKPVSPWCSRCPVEAHCERNGVKRAR